MDNNEFLFEGMVERMNTVSVYNKSPYILWEQHATERIFKHRDFISIAQIPSLNPSIIEEDLVRELKTNYLDIEVEWMMANPKVTNTKVMPRFQEVKWVIRKPYKLTYFDNRTNKKETVMIEATMQGSYNTLFSMKHRDAVKNIWFNTEGDANMKFDAINRFLASKSPTFKSDILQGRLGFNKPYLFIETFVLALIHPTKFPITFSGASKDGKNVKWTYYNTTPKHIDVTFYQYMTMYKKARGLVKMKGLIDLVPAKEIKQLIDANKEE